MASRPEARADRTLRHRWARVGLLTALDRPADAVSYVGPNWFAAVMGTGIVAAGAATLPVQSAFVRGVAVVFWLLAAAILLVVVALTIAHWLSNPTTARAHHRHPTMSHFYGAIPMGLLTVGADTLLLGRSALGVDAAVRIDAVLWTLGTTLGLATYVAIPRLVLSGGGYDASAAFGGWLMPVVAPMVSAATGALLIPFVPSAGGRVAMLIGCYLLFALSLGASVLLIPGIISRRLRGDLGVAALVPTIWIVIGPLGQSVTAVNLLATHSGAAVGPANVRGLTTFAVGYGIPVLALALAWAGVALATTVRTVRTGLPFTLAWWSFVFPLGTCVTGASGLALHSGSVVFRDLAVGLFVMVVLAWSTVAVRTVHAGLLRGTLLLAPR